MACLDSALGWMRNDAEVSHHGQAEGKLFEMRVTPMALLAGMTGVEEFVDVLRIDRRRHLHRTEAEARTIYETSFFRDPGMFGMLQATVLPELIARRRKQRRLRIWSAACSTGQEAYSVAMLLCEEFPGMVDWDVRIVGTDLSKMAVEAAREGRYRAGDVVGGLADRMRAKYLMRESGYDGDAWVISERVRGMCEFVQGDLCAMEQDVGMFDLVLMRNVLLYLAPAERGRVFCEVRGRVAGDGYLVLGSSERAEDSTRLFEGEVAEGCYVYRPALVG